MIMLVVRLISQPTMTDIPEDLGNVLIFDYFLNNLETPNDKD